jgi:peptidoglycan hydrolase-like protein with peptidoglycan-binding domain
MPNPGQPTISLGATGKAVRRLQRALRRTPNLGLTVDGIFSPQLETAVKQFQQGAGLVADGIVGPLTWEALPDGRPMPVLKEGSSGNVVVLFRPCTQTGLPVSGVQRRKGSTASSGPIPRQPSRHFNPGVA